MKEFHFNHLKAFLTSSISISFILLGGYLIKEGMLYESKVLIDTNGILWVIIGIILMVYGITETRLVWIAISFTITKITIENNQIAFFGKKGESKIEFSKIKKVILSERETFTRKSVSNDIGYTKIETYDQGSIIITSFLVKPKKLSELITIPSSKKVKTDRKPFKGIS